MTAARKKRPGPGQPKHNWPEIRRQYIEGVQVNGDPVRYPTLDEIAKTWGIDESYVRNVASKERWTGQREAWQHMIEEARKEKRAATIATYGAEWDERCLNDARAGLALVEKRMVELSKIANVDSKDLHALMNAMATAQRVGKIALGESLTGDEDRPRTIRIVREERALPEDD